MKRIKNSDINFKINPKLVNLKNFTMKFYTVNSQLYFFSKNQDDVVEVERDATVYDEDIIASGGTVAVDYYLKLDWSELVYIGEGVLSYKCINNTRDTDFPDTWYNRLVERTTEYYIDSDITVEPSEEKSVVEKLTELDTRLGLEGVERTEADEFISGVVDTYIASNDEALANEVARAISAETDLNIALVEETERAITKEGELTDLINNLRQDLTDESEIRSSADTTIWAAINGEVNRAVSAETVIATDLADEVLRATTTELTISGRVENYITSNDTALAAEVNRATRAESGLSDSITAETTRATRIETEISATVASNYSALTTAIGNEETRAEAQESALNTKIEAETTRAIAKEDAISGALDTYKVSNNSALQAEITRATSAETAISGKLDTYITSNNLALSNEVSRATEKENIISGRLESYISTNNSALANEIERATNKENAISGKLDTYISTNNSALQAETTRATSAETQIATDLSNYISSNDHLLSDEIARATAKENAISGKLDTYIASNDSGVTTLETALAAEVSRATAKELELSGYVDTRVEAIVGAAPGALDTLEEIAEKLADDDDAIASIINSITSETSARTNADTALGTRIDNLITASTAAITAEENRAKEAESGITNAINNEVTRATSAETQLSTSINGEITRATGAEGALDTRIDNLVSSTTANLNSEITRATGIENAISGKLDTYIASNDSSISATNTALSNEVARAQSAESGLTSSISTEVARATGEESRIETKIDNYIVSNNAALNAETLRAVSAETALSARIDVLTGVTDVIYGETIRASQAEAALSGAIDSLSSTTSGSVTDLATAITNETNRAQSAETEISATVASNYSALTTAIGNEETRAEGVENALSGAIDTKLAISDFNIYSGTVNSDLVAISGVVDTKLYTSAFTSYSATIATTIEDNELVTSEALNNLNSRINNTYTKSEVDSAITNVDVSDQLSGYVKTSAFTAYSANVNSDLVAISGVVDTKFDASGITDYYTSAQTESRLTSYQSQLDNCLSQVSSANTKAENAIAIANAAYSAVVQSDWEETDTTNKAYIQNKPFGETTGGVSIYTNLSKSLSQCGQYQYGELNNGLTMSEPLVDGEVYIVTVNGNSFTFTATTSSNIVGCNWNGNPSTVETVAIWYNGNDYNGANISIHSSLLNGNTSTASINIAKSGTVITQIDNKFINYSGSTYVQSLVARIEALEAQINDWRTNGISAGDY